MEIILTMKFHTIKDDFDPLRKKMLSLLVRLSCFHPQGRRYFFVDVAKLIAACTRAYFSHFSNQRSSLMPFKPGACYSKKRSFSLSVAERISPGIEVGI